MRNPYQEQLAERSLVSEEGWDGEFWHFYWYTDPLATGLAEWKQFHVYVSKDDFRMLGLLVPHTEEECLAQEEAIQFIRERYERYDFDEENWN